jgi:hypothetical protein
VGVLLHQIQWRKKNITAAAHGEVKISKGWMMTQWPETNSYAGVFIAFTKVEGSVAELQSPRIFKMH